MADVREASSIGSATAANEAARSEHAAPITSPSSRFTAVNGRDNVAATAAPHDSLSGVNHQHNHTSPDRRSSDERSRDELWGRRLVNGDQPQSARSSTASHPQAPSEPLQENSPNSATQKRKRSHSSELVEERSRSLKANPENRLPALEGPSESHGPRLPSLQTSGSPLMNSAQSYGYGTGHRTSHSESNISEPSAQTYHSDAQIAEVLQRESQSMDANQSADRAESIEDEDSRSSAPRSTEYSTPTSAQVDHKRRKRVFSNRTKTGCLTCRRRKKKCDETKPECNNCIRGGFVCEGYSSRVEWQKSSNAAKPPVLLQSKDGELRPVGGDSPQHHHHTLPNGQVTEDDYSSRRPQSIPAPHPPVPLAAKRMEEGQHHHHHQSHPGEPTSAGEWGKPAWPNSATSPYHPEHLSKTGFSRVPGLHELRTDAPEASTPQSAVSHRSILHASHSTSPQTPQQAQAQAQAQMALQHPAAMRGRPPTEKEKMLRGELYFASDPALVNERERCKAACWRFNNSTNPNLDVSPEERARLFRKIIQSEESMHPPSSPNGRVGEGVVVEAPLTCDYGYNIEIGDEVSIAANCTILDTCSVKIGKRCVLGPNVNIYTATLPVDPRRRKGSQGPSHGKPITIEDDCFIGGGVTILPGIKIGRSSTVGAGSVVTRDVPNFTVSCGNPARVVRGIYREADD